MIYSVLKYPYLCRLSSYTRRCRVKFYCWRDLEFAYNLDLSFYKNMY